MTRPRSHSWNPGRLAVELNTLCMNFLRVKYVIFQKCRNSIWFYWKKWKFHLDWCPWVPDLRDYWTPAVCRVLSGLWRLWMVVKMLGTWGVENSQGERQDWETSCSQMSPNSSYCGSLPHHQPVTMASMAAKEWRMGQGQMWSFSWQFHCTNVPGATRQDGTIVNIV